MTDQAPTGDAVARILRGHQYLYTDERELSDALADALTAAGLEPAREVILNPRDRLDILTGSVAVEVKIAGGVEALTRQLQRYAQSDQVTELVVVTDRSAHRGVPKVVGGVPVHVVYLASF